MLPRLMPALTMLDGQVYRTQKFKKPRYIGDPINAVKIFNDKRVDELVVFDISGRKGLSEDDFVEQMKNITSQAFMPMAYGGGVFSLQDAERVFEAGFEKVILNSVLFSKPELIREIANIYGTQSVVASIDASKAITGKMKLYCRHKNTKGYKSYIDLAHSVEELGAGELIIRDVSKDGMMEGMNLNLIHEVSSLVNIPVVASGGAWTLSHVKAAVEAGAHSVVAGNMFVYQGERKAVLINYPSQEKIEELFRA